MFLDTKPFNNWIIKIVNQKKIKAFDDLTATNII